MRRAIGLATVLVAFWLLLSGHYTALLLVLGAASVAFVVWIAHRMDIVDHEQPLHLTLSLPPYVIWLAGKVLQSSLVVARRVWSRRPGLSPTVGKVPTQGMSELAQAIYANSITLTPGTLSMHLEDEDIEVHSLDRSGLVELQDGAMLGRVRRLEDR